MNIGNQTSTSSPVVPAASSSKKVNWKQVSTFVGLTFGLTWVLDLVLFLKGGLTNPAAIIVLQLQMLLPAFSAMLLGMFFFKDSPINIKNNHSKSKWFTWYFLLFTLLYAVAVIISFIRPELVQTISSVMLIPGLVGMILVIVLRAVGGKDTFAGVGMGGGKVKLWFLFGLGIIAFAGLQTLLSWLFKMGQPVDLSATCRPGSLDRYDPSGFHGHCNRTNNYTGTIFRAAGNFWRRIRLAWLFAVCINRPGSRARGGSGWHHLGHLALAGYLDGL